jgi:hypothetical protein
MTQFPVTAHGLLLPEVSAVPTGPEVIWDGGVLAWAAGSIGRMMYGEVVPDQRVAGLSCVTR